ncbi:hypothetical protein HPP92_021309 [Vanilla planifolia]|uniref:1-phosphatidylinositol 4-kinase n=1 Tax=Vanilla planifolia TaxID=51239 RepID=A0A835UIN1_VANPL|nr:hypothetical protein HPP92_021309 [Vanilla planifolia]
MGAAKILDPVIFPVEEVHKIAVLDLRLANADRHSVTYYSAGKEKKVVGGPSLLKFYGWEPSLRSHELFANSFHHAEERGKQGLTPYEIGNILCRESIKKESKD